MRLALYAVTDPETNSGNSANKQRSSVFRVSVKPIQTLETTTMKTSLGSLLASTMQAIGAGFRAFFTFSEMDARILASAYGFPPAGESPSSDTNLLKTAIQAGDRQ
jgi:hypothetical protein